MTKEELQNIDTRQKLYLPHWCIIPEEIKNDDSISDAEKIFFGDLTVLSNEKGFCWGKDEEFAELKKKSIRTIQRFFENLENNGYILREVIQISYRSIDGALRWKKDRKIWVGKAKLKKFPNTTKMADTSNSVEKQKFKKFPNTTQMAGSYEHDKNGEFYKEENKNQIKKLTNPSTPQSPKPKVEPKKLVSFSLFEKEEILSDFELSSSEMKSLLSQTQELSLDVFKESIQAFLDYRKKTDVQSNFAVLWKALGCGGDQPWQAKDCNSIEEKNKAIADKLKITNGQTIRGWLFSRCNDCIEFSHACHSKVFEFSSHSFEKNLRDFLEKLGESALLNA